MKNGWRTRIRRRWWQAYLILLLASHLYQWATYREPAPNPDYGHVQLPAFRADGTTTGTSVDVAYREWGSGEPMILLHGSPGRLTNFSRLQPLLSDDFRVIAIDLPGFGRSTKSVPDYSIKAHARYVLAVMDELGVDRAHVFGYSMGSGVAIDMVGLAPERVSSLILYGGLGVQEGEGSGDYYFEHAKYAVGYAALVALPELIPHFGLLGRYSTHQPFIRNFWDTDQRPLRGILESLETPLLILHGRDDFLVPARAAEEHHRIVEHSELVMFDASHFMVFSEAGAPSLAEETIAFAKKYSDPLAVPQRRTLIHAPPPAEVAVLPFDLKLDHTIGPWRQLIIIAAGTFITEDLTCITVGMLAAQLQVDVFVGVVACILGIFLSDMGLWLLGRLLSRGRLRQSFLARRLPEEKLEALGAWFDRKGWAVIVASRFMPGTRVPIYVAAGFLGHKGGRFALWTFIAVLLWTPPVVILSMMFGEAFVGPFERWLGAGWIAFLLAAVVVFAVIRVLMLALTSMGRCRLIAGVSRLWRWEFWPMWFFNLPVAAWVGLLSLRYRGFTTFTAANPGIPDGGVVGESKHDILSMLPERWIVPTFLSQSLEPSDRAPELQEVMEQRGWSFPLVLKPDAGQRGSGVKLARTMDDVAAYPRSNPQPLLVQTYHRGPYEAGIFYYRMPTEDVGHIFSITDKHFPELIGDGESTFEQLIWRHPRFRMQARKFLDRHPTRIGTIPGEGERIALVVAGNHCQGTMFCDGAHLITPQLEKAIDEIAQCFEGFYFGRFDVRYDDVEAFKRGEGFKIIELNGATSESTNVYDPTRSLLWAYRTLFRQWSLVYKIGDQNRRRGHPTTPLLTLLRSVVSYYRGRKVNMLAD